MAMTEKTRIVFDFLKANVNNEEITADVVAEATGLTSKQVIGAFNGGILRKGLGYYVKDNMITLEDGTTVKRSYMFLNDEGMEFDPDAPETEE